MIQEQTESGIIITNEAMRCLAWCQLLCEVGCGEELKNTILRSKSEILGIMEYRRQLHENGKSMISFIEINQAYIDKKYTLLHKLLEKLFLECILCEQFEYILDKITKTEGGIFKMYDMHIANKNARILNVTLRL